ncbi:phytoene synthase, partial [Penicillium herquei]
HVTYNLPLSFGLTALFWPFLTRIDLIKITFLVIVSVLATTPWDSYLVRNKVWTYPETSVSGMTLFSVPIEEVFFFCIQTYNTSMIYTIVTRRLVMPAYLKKSDRMARISVALLLALLTVIGVGAFQAGGKYTYIGMILGWACSWLLFQWIVCSHLAINLPIKELLISVMLPTTFLWMVDTLSLGNGTWVIENSTKLDIQVWGKLDIEEALFFLVTNIMIVQGMIIADCIIAETDLRKAQSVGEIESGLNITEALLSFVYPPEKTNDRFVSHLNRSVRRLASASQSMYMGSAMFYGALRIDLIFLYSFCRLIDDLVDGSESREVAERIINECARLLDVKFKLESELVEDEGDCSHEVELSELKEAIEHLPVSRLRLGPLRDLLEGFRLDLQFNAFERTFPISTEMELDRYAYHVAGTVAICILDLVSHHFPCHTFAADSNLQDRVVEAGCEMGKALQYVNIARDIGRDAAINRVYIPTTWLKEAGLSPEDVLFCPTDPRIQNARSRLLAKANYLHERAQDSIRKLPSEVQGPLRATVESYMEIGTALENGAQPHRPYQKLRLSIPRRLFVVYKAMSTF